MAWTDEKKERAVALYLEQGPTPENSMEIVKQVAEELEETPNGVRMILNKAEVYIKKAATAVKTGTSTAEGKKPARVSKADAQASLEASIKAAGFEVDADITSKLTGKAAIYFADIIAKIGN